MIPRGGNSFIKLNGDVPPIRGGWKASKSLNMGLKISVIPIEMGCPETFIMVLTKSFLQKQMVK